jgi:hypothetical protein
VRVRDNRLRDAAEHEPLQPGAPMRSDDNQIGLPLVGGVDNHRPQISLANGRFDTECGSRETLTSSFREAFGFLNLPRPNVLERR